MKKILLGLMALSSIAPCLQAHADVVYLGGAPNSWKPAVGDDAIYDFYEEQPNADGVFTGTLEKKVTAVTDSNVTVQVTLTKQDYDSNPAVTTTKSINQMMMDIQNVSQEMADCNLRGDSMIPLSILTGAGNFSSCLMRPMLGTDLDGDPAVTNVFIANVPFQITRQDTIKTGNGNHIRLTLKQLTPAQK